ncbi:MAG: SDR family NAD(P)-dependent oxidoreductase, partial [Patescibacteria group bacterium]
NYRDNEKAAKKTLAEILQADSDGILVQADVSSLKDVKALVRKVINKYGRLDFLVNNAGFIRDALIEQMSPRDWDDVIKIHLYGSFYLMKYCLPYLSKTKGAIINITSRAAFKGFFGQANYATAKAGLTALTKTAAHEFGKYGVRVNAVSPPFIRTDLVVKHRKRKYLEKKAIEESLLGIYGNTSDFAKFVVWLLSNEAREVTGQVFMYDSRLY